jgi:hypothetical protein
MWEIFLRRGQGTEVGGPGSHVVELKNSSGKSKDGQNSPPGFWPSSAECGISDWGFRNSDCRRPAVVGGLVEAQHYHGRHGESARVSVLARQLQAVSKPGASALRLIGRVRRRQPGASALRLIQISQHALASGSFVRPTTVG